ncbi:B3 domain-containing protein At1g05920-like [Raphanus sativus]|nr:B3 domain-containing protein At1g05920-like [Raphanus sativus]XP_056867202.1 B3 domain-containing protein At1g05920-like [Raphanus sativus]
MWNLPGFSKTVKDEEKEKSMRRIFHLFPKRKRSLRVPSKKTLSPPHVSSSILPIKKRPVLYTTTPPKWIRRLKKDMNIADDPILIAGKPLDLNDVDPDLNRLSIPSQTLQRNDFLTSDEGRILGDEGVDNDGRMGLPAFLVDQRTKRWNVVLKKWVRTCDSGKVLQNFLLSGDWSGVVEANGLKEEDNVSLWFFRLNGFLFFALDLKVTPLTS